MPNAQYMVKSSVVLRAKCPYVPTVGRFSIIHLKKKNVLHNNGATYKRDHILNLSRFQKTKEVLHTLPTAQLIKATTK